MKIGKLFKSVLIVIMLILVFGVTLKRMKKGNSQILYNKIVESMKIIYRKK